MPEVPLWHRYAFMQYTGSNKSDILAMLDTSVSIDSPFTTNDTGATWFVSELNGSATTINVNDYVVVDRCGTLGSAFITSSSAVLDAAFSGVAALVAQLSGDTSFIAAVTAAGTATRAFTNSASRSLTTSTGAAGFRVSATRDAFVGYDVTLSTTATIGGAASSLVLLEIAPTNSATAGDWLEIARLSNTQTITLAVALQSVQGLGGRLSGIVPAGWYAKLRQTNTGTASATYNTGQEVLL